MTSGRRSPRVDLGLDFGSTGLRAAYSAPGTTARFVTLDAAQWPWLLFEPTPSGPLPVSFPTVKSTLGAVGPVRCDGEAVDPFGMVVRGFGAARRLVQTAASAGIGKTVISVPARFSARQQATVRDAAGEAGLTDVGLVNDSVAAVIGHTRGAQDGVFLVYGMGYSGAELGLVRAQRGRYRALGQQSLAEPGGSTFDEEVLAWLIRILRQRSGSVDPSQWDESRWRRLRDDGQLIKEELGAPGPAVCHGVVHDDAGNRIPVDIERVRFATLLRHHVELVLDRAQVLFAQAGLTSAGVSTVLLSGGSTQLGQLPTLLAGLGHQVVPVSAESVARGAVWLAEHQGADVPASTPGEQVVTSAAGFAGATSPGIDQARRLIDQGRSDEAAAMLRALVEQARLLLEELTTPSPSALPQLLLQARSLVQQGRCEAAVAASHQARQEEPTRPDVFEAMIDIHCAAAMVPDGAAFSDADRWLRCAYHHDPSNTRVRDLLAERTYRHARDLSRSGKYREAVRAVDQSLVWDPDHRGAHELEHRLGRVTSVRSRGARRQRDER
ncbi:MAG: Hsp70 family protein [Pseudonocardiaceae bacterium]